MRRRGRHILIVWCCTLLQLVGAAGPASGVVLCVAEDGHITFERPHGATPCAADYVRHHAPSARTVRPDEGHRHNCVDTLLSSPLAWRSQELWRTAGAAPSCGAIGSLPWRPSLPPWGTRQRARTAASTPAAGLASLRTVILLV
jgi:hypothetical protein